MATFHSPRPDSRPVTCLGDRRQTSHDWFPLRDRGPSRTAAVERHTVDSHLYCTGVELETAAASRVNVETSERACWLWSRPLLTQSSAISHTNDHRLQLARYRSHQRCTTGCRLDSKQCPVALWVLRLWSLTVGWTFESRTPLCWMTCERDRTPQTLCCQSPLLR